MNDLTRDMLRGTANRVEADPGVDVYVAFEQECSARELDFLGTMIGLGRGWLRVPRPELPRVMREVADGHRA